MSFYANYAKPIAVALPLGFCFAAQAKFDGSQTLLCSFGQITECDRGAECRPVSHNSVDAPDFVKLDFDQKHISSLIGGIESPPDDIDQVVDLGDFLALQGLQGGVKGAGNTLAWSMTIQHQTGRMTLSGSGENTSFVIFGACTTY